MTRATNVRHISPYDGHKPGTLERHAKEGTEKRVRRDKWEWEEETKAG